jgi:RimJ/RimL family protein N-acetyltransferase
MQNIELTDVRLAAAPFDEAETSLRPIQLKDIELLRAWRNTDRVRLRMFQTGLISPEWQRAWWRRYASEPGYRQLLLAYRGEPLGTISFTTDAVSKRTTCGYYIGAESAPRRAGTLLLYAGLCDAFRVRGEREIVAEILTDNEPSLRLVRRFGFVQAGKPVALLGGGRRGAAFLVFSITSETFEANAPAIRNLIFAS